MTDKYYHLKLYRLHLAMGGNITHNLAKCKTNNRSVAAMIVTCIFYVHYILIFISAIRNGERCDPRSDKCLSKFTMCAGVCKCLDFFEHTKDGRCKLPNAGYIGDYCTTRGCQYPSTCVNGICGCQHPLRELSVDEFWVSPQSTLQCRDHAYSLCKYTHIIPLMAMCDRYNIM